MSKINTPASVRTRAQFDEWKRGRRQGLEHRLWQAERAHFSWPSSDTRCRVFHLQRELEQLLATKFPTPAHTFNTAQAIWPPRPA